VEASRKHGPFDTRWPSARKDRAGAVSTAPPLRAEEAAEALDWQAFSAYYFPKRRRHNFEALSAYAAYTQGREWRTPATRLRLVPSEPTTHVDEREEAGTRRLMAAMAAAPARKA
jgi:hypothetical protein